MKGVLQRTLLIITTFLKSGNSDSVISTWLFFHTTDTRLFLSVSCYEGCVGTVLYIPRLSSMVHLGWERHRGHEECSASPEHGVVQNKVLMGIRGSDNSAIFISSISLEWISAFNQAIQARLEDLSFAIQVWPWVNTILGNTFIRRHTTTKTWYRKSP